MTTTSTPTILQVEHVLWNPGSEWDAALEHVASRFARVHPLDLDNVRGAGTFEQQHAVLADWASGTDIDLDRELGRFLDEHLSMHVRPDPKVTRSVRALAAESPVHAVTVLGPRAGESVLRHAGCWRSITQLHAGVSPDARESVLPDARLVSAVDEIPR